MSGQGPHFGAAVGRPKHGPVRLLPLPKKRCRFDRALRNGHTGALEVFALTAKKHVIKTVRTIETGGRYLSDFRRESWGIAALTAHAVLDARKKSPEHVPPARAMNFSLYLIRIRISMAAEGQGSAAPL